MPQAVAGQSDAWLDEGARELVRLGRERRRLIDRSVLRYTVDVQERISAGLRTVGRERLFFRRETAGHIDWTRNGPIRIEVTGAREVIPPIMKNAQIPENLRGFMPHLAFDPVENDIFIRFDTTFLRHPLAADAEAHYRYRSGDTTSIRLPDGREVRLIELVIIPRRDDIHLLTGSFWMEAETHAVVRAVFRPARAFDYDRDADEDDDAPGFLKPIRAELLYITIEYGLWEYRWWLPRLMAAEGVMQVSFVSMPLRYERRYVDYSVEGDTALAASTDTVRTRPCRPGMQLTVRAGGDRSNDARQRRAEARARADSLAAAERATEPPDSAALERERCRQRFQVIVPEDSAALLNSDRLPQSAFGDDIELMTGLELANLRKELDQLPGRPWQLRPPTFAWALGGSGLLRYNRVEALSIGARSQLDVGRLTIDGSARIGLADLEPNAEIMIARETPGGLRRLGVYRRLAPSNPDVVPLGIGNSLGAMLFGRDDGEYFRAWGVEIEARPPRASRQGYGLRVYAEHQSAAQTETDFSLRHLLNDGHTFRPNIAALEAEQVGASLVLRTSHGYDPVGFRWGAEASVTAETGTFEFVRPGATLRAAIPLGPLALGLETAAGTSFGEPPLQTEWFLGGPATLRGYHGGVTHGLAYWRGRAELSGSAPAARITLFSDAGWAGRRDAFGTRHALVSAGAGASFLDGLIRFEIARALRRPLGWRADFYVSRGL